MMVFSPFLHYILKTSNQEAPDGYVAGLRCIAAAIRHVTVLDQYADVVSPEEGHFYLSFGLVFAAIALLLVEIAGAAPVVVEKVAIANATAERLLRRLASQSQGMFVYYESLQVCKLLQLHQQKRCTDFV